MKKLYILRHAKAASNFTGKDFDKPLAKRGQESAPVMAKKMKSRGIQSPSVLCSAANRTQQTLALMNEVLEIPENRIQYFEDLYLAPASAMLNHLRNASDEFNELIILGHNPGVSELINYLSSEMVGDVPTNTVACVLFDTDSWKKVNANNGKLGYYIYPKMFNI